MRKKIIKENSKGITLIALVITIIVLLILAGVSIATLVGENGVIKKATTAKEKTQKAETIERVQMEVVGSIGSDGKVDIEALNENLRNNLSGLTYNDEEITEKNAGSENRIASLPASVKIDGYEIEINDDGDIETIQETDIQVGQLVAYDPTVTDKNGTKVESETLKYTSPKGTGTSHGNGNSDQTFTAKPNNGSSNSLKWRILDINNGTITLVSDRAVKTDSNSNFILQGAIGYLYAEQELNEICKIYGHGYGADTSKSVTCHVGGPADTGNTDVTIKGTAARSITVDDINKVAGIKEENKNLVYSDGTEVQKGYGDKTKPTSNIYYPTMTQESGKSESAGVKELEYNYYVCNNQVKIPDENGIKTTLISENYWLASRCTGPHATDCKFLVCRMGDYNTGAVDLCRGYGSKFTEQTYDSFAVRPVVTLKSNVIDTDAKYHEKTGWRLQ